MSGRRRRPAGAPSVAYARSILAPDGFEVLPGGGSPDLIITHPDVYHACPGTALLLNFALPDYTAYPGRFVDQLYGRYRIATPETLLAEAEDWKEGCLHKES